MKRILCLLVVLAMVMPTFGLSAMANGITVLLNGEKMEFDVPPIILNGRTLVPLRAIFESLGAEVSWDSISETAIGVRRGVKVSVTVNSSAATINGKAVTLDQPAVLMDGRTLVPLRFISEAYGCEVGWDQATQTVSIKAAPSYPAFHITSALFDDRGTWKFSGDMLVGTQTGISEGENFADKTKDAVSIIKITEPGKYNLWVRDRDYANNQPGTRFFRIAVDGVTQDKILGAHGMEGFRWTFVSELDLTEGEHKFALQDTSCFFARCEGFFLTKDLEFVPPEDTEELKKTIVPESELDGMPMAIYPQWTKEDITPSNTVTIGNGSTEITFFEGMGRRGAVVQNEIKIKDKNGNPVVVKSRNEELGFLMLAAENSEFVGYAGSTNTEAEGVTALQKVTLNGKTVETNTDVLYSAGIPYWFIPNSVEKISDTHARLYFDEQNGTALTVDYSFDGVSEEPKVTINATFGNKGAYSFLLYSGDEITDGSYERVTAPFLYVKKRVPEKATMVPSCYLYTPMATFTQKNGDGYITKGVAIDPVSVPREVPYPETSQFCLTLRTPTGNLRGQFAAPQFGTKHCLFEAGDSYSVSYRIINSLDDWYETYSHVSRDIYDNADVRENYYNSINDAIYNLDALMLDDVYGGWDAKNMSWYNMEAKGVSSQSDFMTAIQRYLLTGNEEMLEKRAVPTVANMLSRINAHFCRFDIETTYTTAPTVLSAEPKVGNASVLEGIYEMSQGRMPYLLNNAIAKNSITSDVIGITAQNAFYKMTGEDKYLQQIKLCADSYIEYIEGEKYLTSYFDQAFVFGDYLPKVAALYFAYEVTGEEKYLEAAERAAHNLVTSTWTIGYHNGYSDSPYEIDPAKTEALHTIRCDSSATSNWFMHGMTQWRLGYPYGVYGKTADNPKKIQAETVKGWMPTVTGFGTEHPVTAAHGNSITMNTWAPLLVSLAQKTGDELLEIQARNAMVGRFGNYPGYYQDRYITHQQKADYPYEGPDYTLIYWHHIPVFQSMLEDFLFTSVMAASEGNIDIPSLYQHGYAYFITRQYGHRPGKFYDVEGLWPWLQKGVITPDNVNVDYLMGRKDGTFAAALLNESAQPLTTTVTMGENLPGGIGYNGTGTVYDAKGNKSQITVADGKFTVTIPAKGILTVILPMADVKAPSYALDNIRYTLDNHKTKSDHTNGHGYVIQLSPEKYYSYVYVTDMAKDMKALNMTYTANGKTETVTVDEYPFEFITRVDSDSAEFTYTLEAVMQDNTKKNYGGGILAPISYGAETNLDGFKAAEPAKWGSTEMISGKMIGAGSGGGVFRLVADYKDYPFDIETDNLIGSKIAVTITNSKTGEQHKLISVLTGNEPRSTNIVLKVMPTDEVPIKNFGQDWSLVYNLYPPKTEDSKVKAPDVEIKVEEEKEQETIVLPDTFKEPITADLKGMGVNVHFRAVLELNKLPFEIGEDTLKGLKASVEISDKETGDVKVLENEIVGNEMRTGQTVIKLNFTEAVPGGNFSDGKRYKGKITIYPNL